MQSNVQIVWFKRDLRLHDHPALHLACQFGGPTILLYVDEPSLQKDEHYSNRHFVFQSQAFNELKERLFPLSLIYVQDEVISVLKEISSSFHITRIISHQETGLNISFQRDKQIAQYCQNNRIEWKEVLQNPVFRRLKSRQNWDKMWFQFYNSTPKEPDLTRISTPNLGNQNYFHSNWVTTPDPSIEQKGGEIQAIQCVSNWLEERSKSYIGNISKPTESRYGCSRLSPYIAWGQISTRLIWQKMNQFVKANPSRKRAIGAFLDRMKWRDHFMQKFESDCSYEFKSINPVYESIRNTTNQAYFEAWKSGKTGIPLVDASMRCVLETGYLNFRMRAMLVSFLTHHLWQPWKLGAAHLAKAFLDFEPGIHYPQFQMQASNTGINTIRIYNPIKQAEEHDPNAIFIQKWLPELENLPPDLAREPWKITQMDSMFYNFKLGEHYPFPIVDIQQTGNFARDTLFQLKQTKESRKAGKEIMNIHVRPTQKTSQERPSFEDL